MMAEHELSEQEILQLLRDAEQRLGTSKTDSSPPSQVILSGRETSISTPTLPAVYVKATSHGAEIDKSRLITAQDRKLAGNPRVVEDPIAAKAAAIQEKKATAGSDWFNLPRTVLTPELKRDLQLLRMRSVLDPKRHYKKDNRKSEVPEFSQVGTIIEGPTEFFTARLTNKERKRTLVEDVLAGEKQTHRFKAKYNAIQAAKTSGKKAHYKALKAKREKKSKG